MSLTCGYLPPDMRQVSNAAGYSHGGFKSLSDTRLRTC